jgi:hypothetical protein
MSKFEWTVNGTVLENGELVAHFDDDNELVIDGTVEPEKLADDAIIALREDGLNPDQFRDFTWENYACYAAGLTPWETTLMNSKDCKQCGKEFDRQSMGANNPWSAEKYFQNAQICNECAAKIDDPIADNWEA